MLEVAAELIKEGADVNERNRVSVESVMLRCNAMGLRCSEASCGEMGTGVPVCHPRAACEQRTEPALRCFCIARVYACGVWRGVWRGGVRVCAV